MFTLLFNNIYKNKNRDIQLDYAWIVFVYTNIYDFYYNFLCVFGLQLLIHISLASFLWEVGK